MNDFRPLLVVACFMAITAVLVSTISLISSTHGFTPSLAECGFVAVLCFGAYFFQALYKFLVKPFQLDDIEVAE